MAACASRLPAELGLARPEKEAPEAEESPERKPGRPDSLRAEGERLPPSPKRR